MHCGLVAINNVHFEVKRQDGIHHPSEMARIHTSSTGRNRRTWIACDGSAARESAALSRSTIEYTAHTRAISGHVFRDVTRCLSPPDNDDPHIGSDTGASAAGRGNNRSSDETEAVVSPNGRPGTGGMTQSRRHDIIGEKCRGGRIPGASFGVEGYGHNHGCNGARSGLYESTTFDLGSIQNDSHRE